MLIINHRIIELDQAVSIGSPLLSQRQDTPKEIAKPVRPLEFRLFMAVPFVGLFILLAISLAVLFFKARPNGMYTFSASPRVDIIRNEPLSPTGSHINKFTNF
jgi:hypothetical protein